MVARDKFTILMSTIAFKLAFGMGERVLEVGSIWELIELQDSSVTY